MYDGSNPPTLVYDNTRYDGRTVFGATKPSDFIVYDGRLIFRMRETERGTELYAYDATTGETTLLPEVNSSTGSFIGSNPQLLTVYDGKLYYQAEKLSGFTTDAELWVYDAALDQVSQVADLNTNPPVWPYGQQDSDSYPYLLGVYDGDLIFTAFTAETGGRALFRYNSQSDEVSLMADYWTPRLSSDPTSLTSIDGQVFFSRETYASQYSDSRYVTSGGRRAEYLDPSIGRPVFVNRRPIRAPEFEAGYVDGYVERYGHPLGRPPVEFIAYAGRVFYNGFNSTATYLGQEGDVGIELFSFDPSADPYSSDRDRRFRIEADIIPGLASSSPADFVVLNGTLYFSARDPAIGRELYSFDDATGQTGWTDIRPGTESSAPADVIVYDGALYFSADDGTSGRELWRWDPAGGSPQLAADLVPGTEGGEPEDLYVLGGQLYFTADGGTSGRELWRYDAMSQQAARVTEIAPGPDSSHPRFLTAYEGALYFSASAAPGDTALWQFVPGDDLTERVQDAESGQSIRSPAHLAVFDGVLYFSGTDAASGAELWSYHHAEGQLRQEADLRPGAESSAPSEMVVADGRLYFAADDGSTRGRELWSFRPVPPPPQDVPPGLRADIYPGMASSSPEGLTVYGDRIYFAANDAPQQQELWAYDPGTQTAQLAADLNPAGEGRPRELTVYDGRLFFRGDDGTHGQELWVFDRLTQAASMVADLNPGSDRSRPEWLTVYDGKLYFSADDGATGRELYVYDAATDELRQAADIQPGGGGSSSTPRWLTVYDDRLYFQADDGNTSAGAELWAFDGTDAQLVDDIREGGESSSPGELTVFDEKLYFRAGTDATGDELFVYDHAEARSGAPASARLAQDLQPGPGDGFPEELVAYDGHLYFRAQDFDAGAELWVFDGTGASRVADLRPGPRRSYPEDLTVYNNGLYFSAETEETGRELFVYNGLSITPATDIQAGPASSSPRELVVYGRQLYFQANDGVHGREVWSFEAADVIPVELAAFSVLTDGRDAVLSWTTASETGNAGFDVEHKAPGATVFQKRAFVKGAGTTTAPQRYRHRFAQLRAGQHEFRLRQVDLNGTSTLSPVQLVVLRGGGLQLSPPTPHPASQASPSEMILQSDEKGAVRVVLYDILGRRVATLFDGTVVPGRSETIRVDPSQLASGHYFCRVEGLSQALVQRLTVVR